MFSHVLVSASDIGFAAAPRPGSGLHLACLRDPSINKICAFHRLAS